MAHIVMACIDMATVVELLRAGRCDVKERVEDLEHLVPDDLFLMPPNFNITYF